ncbi:putative small oligopeptide opt family protein [Lasiodiplodia theobromae]|uniref:Small oligopeptide opt family protein n=1 Tax=Lasiodiplodia theobromae TaxID=45133 RepID=A0A8H7IPY0_9PEZI|nr:Small oligopeptide opt family protein [Lasiodiplodia theobromae]KAF4541792.1 Small oligopeptide opt family protein [Lasiodiplodia theobromae]KAF9629808.1 putative small oligopeptide opt family protein [Lasiodiplodia theobromae]
MPSFRKPWPVSRRDTDGITLNTLEDKEATATATPAEVDDHAKAAAAQKDLQTFSDLHRWDPNLESDKRDAIEEAVKKGDVEAEISLDQGLGENSPYPEVASAVPNTDDHTLPCNTIRAWVIGLIFTTIGSGLNMLFNLRNPSITITSIVAQLLSYPIGKLWEKTMPSRQFNLFGLKFSLNPGPFNVKEHTLITIMANVTFGNGVAYSTDTIEALRGFYGYDLGWGFNLLFTFTTQMLGFGLAGSFRRFLVYPAAMIFPQTLPNCALFFTLHKRGSSAPNPADTNGWSISRYRWFLYVVIGGFVWYWFPGFIWQGLSVFAFVTWIKPRNPVINQLFGGYSGLSLIPITFDWTYVTSYIQSPLIPPWHAIANTLIGLVVFQIVTPLGIHYTKAWYSEYLPMSDSDSYDNTGAPYNVSKILTPSYRFDEQKYKAYSPIFLSTTFAMCYGLSFATIVATIVHTALYHHRELWYRARAARQQEDDVHARLMKRYPEAPDWWFWALGLVMIGMGFGTVLGYPTELTWWAYIIAVLIAAAWFVPIGMVWAITNVQIGLNVFTEFVIGYMLPGRPLAMMCFKTIGYITMFQGLLYTQDLKLAHYMKLPPKTVFWAQGVATVWGSVVQIAVLDWAFGAIKDICKSGQSARFTCPNGRVFFNASIIWGAIGPRRMFSGDATYAGLQWFWLIGAVTPVVFYVLARRFPHSPARYLNAPVMFGQLNYIPPATPLIYWAWAIVGLVFNRLIRRRARGWWMTYNYITSAALDSGLALSTIVIFFALLLPQVSPPQWWGNTVIETLDYEGSAVQKTVAPGETFGPSHW